MNKKKKEKQTEKPIQKIQHKKYTEEEILSQVSQYWTM